jgi:hypothetical protein
MGSKLWAVVSLIIVASATVVGVSLITTNDATMGQITVLLGMVATTIPAILASINSEKSKDTVNKLNADLRNGTFEHLLRLAIEKIANEEKSSLEIQDNSNESVGREDNTS